jgi:hypothetical protein
VVQVPFLEGKSFVKLFKCFFDIASVHKVTVKSGHLETDTVLFYFNSPNQNSELLEHGHDK